MLSYYNCVACICLAGSVAGLGEHVRRGQTAQFFLARHQPYDVLQHHHDFFPAPIAGLPAAPIAGLPAAPIAGLPEEPTEALSHFPSEAALVEAALRIVTNQPTDFGYCVSSEERFDVSSKREDLIRDGSDESFKVLNDAMTDIVSSCMEASSSKAQDLLQQCSSLQGPIDALSNIDPVNPDHYNHDAIMKISTLEQQYATCQASKTLLLNAWCRNDESFPQDHKNKLFNLATAFFENDATELETQAARVQDAMGVHPCVEDGGDDDNLFDQVQNAVEKCSEAGNGNTATAASRRIKSLVEGHLDFFKGSAESDTYSVKYWWAELPFESNQAWKLHPKDSKGCKWIKKTTADKLLDRSAMLVYKKEVYKTKFDALVARADGECGSAQEA